jgi:hypothetical protein
MNMREQFEAWMINDYKCVIGSYDPYPEGLERDNWKTWQAAYQAGVLAERERLEGTIDHLLDNVRRECAAAIRKGD